MTFASGVGRKFTIGDVTSSPTLKQAALNFIRGYRGDFEFLVRMKEVEAMVHTFTDGQTKAVLNCMQFDPQGLRYINQAEETEVLDSTIARDVQGTMLALHKRDQPPLSLVPATEKPASFPVEVTWKRPFITADTMGRSHILSPPKSRAIYFREENEIDFVMVAWCGVTRRSIRAMARWARDSSWALTTTPTKPVCRACENLEH